MLRAKLGLMVILGAAAAPLPASAGGGSGIGHGGDVLSRYLDTTRSSLVTVLKILAKGMDDVSGLCRSLSDLTPEQAQLCGEFAREASPQMLGLNRATPPTPLEVVAEPLLLPNPDGTLRKVAAATRPGAADPIQIHYDSVRYLSPGQILQLLSHEFGHKVLFRGRLVDDESPLGPFAHSRQLLDAFGEAVVRFARNSGVIGDAYVLGDFFDCAITLPGATTPQFEYSGASPREFQRAGEFGRYETSIGESPRDLRMSFRESATARLDLRVRIHEEQSCRELAAEEAAKVRWTRIQLVRSAIPPATGQNEVVTERFLPGRNPLCETPGEALEIRLGELIFSCRYGGSSAQVAPF